MSDEQPAAHRRLVYDPPAAHLPGVARLRAILNAHDYDAADTDIWAAYRAWLGAARPGEWDDPRRYDPATVFAGLWEHMRHVDPENHRENAP
jgi:hypothetical protein